MNNLFPPHRDIHRTFDLKGSTIGRDFKEEDLDPRQAIGGVLTRTPSKLEHARKAKELRQMIKTQRPIPMEQAKSGMPEELEEETMKKGFYFYSDDGGFRATHEDERPGEEIYYLGIIDCLTHVSALSPFPADDERGRRADSE